MKSICTKRCSFLLTRGLFTLLICFLASVAYSQNTSGKDFWAVQTPNATNSLPFDTSRYAILVSNVSGQPATVVIEKQNAARTTVSHTIPPGSVKEFFFASENANIQLPGIYNNNVYHITSDKNVVVYTFTPYQNVVSNDASLLLPTHALGKKYVPGSYVNPTVNASGIGNSLASFYGFIATDDATTVKVFNRAGLRVDSVVLQKGDYYQNLFGTGNATNIAANDVTGWYIEASKPIAVFGGNQSTSIGNSTLAADHIEEQILPIETLGSYYVASPTNARPTGCTTCVPDVFRYVATEDNTVINTSVQLNAKKIGAPVGTVVTPISVTVGPSATMGVTINRGEFIEISTNQPHVVSGNNPYYAYQYLISTRSSSGPYDPITSLISNGNLGDPDMMNIPVADQYQFNYNFVIPYTYPNDFILLTAPLGTQITLDGVVISPNWRTAGTLHGVPYVSATYPVTDGAHTITGSKRFGLIVSGIGVVASYSYVGGSGLEPINAGCVTGGPYQYLTCNNTPVSVQLRGNPSCEDGSAPVVQWSSPDGVVFSNPNIANPIATVPGLGAYSVTMTVNCGGNIISCTSDITVRTPLAGCGSTPPPPTIIAPPDVTITNDPGGVPYATNVPVGSAYYNVYVDSPRLVNDAPANGQFPVGITVITWTIFDGLNRSASATQTITVVAPPPSIVAPPPVTLVADYNGLATGGNLEANGPVFYHASVYPVTLIPPSPAASYPIGTTSVTWTVQDGAGRTASDVQLVTVIAPQPIIDPLPDMTVSNDPGQQYATGVNIGIPTFKAMGPYTLTNDAPAQFPLGNTTVTWTLTDVYGNTVTTSHVVTVVSAPPTITPPPAITIPTDPGQNYASGVNLGIATHTVSVDPAVLNNNAPAQFPVGTTTVTWTVTDGLGRTASGTQLVTVVPSACSFTSSITSIPTSNVNTGGNPNKLFIGYGAQSTKLQVTVPSSSGGYTFVWSGNHLGKLSSATSAAPIFTPGLQEGNYTYAVKVKNNVTGCTSEQSITICVTDIRVLDKNGNWDGKKVYVCHLPPGNPANVQIIHVGVAAVPAHVPLHGGDGLGRSCQQTCTPFSSKNTPAIEVFGASVIPNPTSGFFTLQVKSDDVYTKVSVRIMDAFGRTMQIMDNVTPGQAVRFGEKFASGAYYVEVVQGSDRKLLQLVKAK